MTDISWDVFLLALVSRKWVVKSILKKKRGRVEMIGRQLEVPGQLVLIFFCGRDDVTRVIDDTLADLNYDRNQSVI